MNGFITILLFFSNSLLISSSHSLCTDSRPPFTPKTPLLFCSKNGKVCCDSNQDMGLKKSFQAMNISDPACASLIKSILCAKCDQFSGNLFKSGLRIETVPTLCTISSNSSYSTSSRSSSSFFCEKVWDKCHDIPILNSPFLSPLQSKANVKESSTYSKFTDFWQSKSGFCEEFGGFTDDGKSCFNGESVFSHNVGNPNPPPNGICLEQIRDSSYIDMAAHPDGSNRVFLASLQGIIWLATVPDEESIGILEFDEANPFLDISDIVNPNVGIMSLAFHPNFVRNGRFFVSYQCDRIRWPACSGRCACNTEVNCDPSKLHALNGVPPCQYHLVVSEFTANGTTSQPSLAARANPLEVRRIFTMGITMPNAPGGEIIFGPDGYLYFTKGDGEDGVDPYNFAQNKKSLLGKIMRLDIDNLPSAAEISKLELWGNYSIPRDNPYSYDKELRPEIWAMGFRNPWRCSFDSERPSYFFCGDSGKDQYEEVDVIKKGGNYGWPFYEGTFPFHHLPNSSQGDTSVGLKNTILPVLGYDHSAQNTKVGSSSIAGGHFYRSKSDPCLYGRYLYTDLYGFAIWAGTESPENSGNFTSHKLSFKCARNSPIKCSFVEGNLGFVYSMGLDNRKDVYILINQGVLRVVRPSRCNFTCPKEKFTAYKNPQQSLSPSRGSSFRVLRNELWLFFSFYLFLFLDFSV